MRVGGVWLGLGLHDSDPEIARFKAFLKRKFKWVRDWTPPLDSSELFNETLTNITIELQRRYDLPTSGILNYATKLACGFVKPPTVIKPTLLTVCGTGVPWWVGPDADVARACEDKYYWQPVGYPAKPFPMWPSIIAGIAELNHQIDLHPGQISMVGYSQGAVVVSMVYKYDLLPPSGRLHHRLGDLKKVVTYGSPMRELGRVWSDGVGEMARKDCAGILEDRLVDTPSLWRDYGHKGDLYTDCEMNDEGEFKRAICKIVMGSNVFGGSDSILAQIVELGLRPVKEGIAAMQAIIDAGMFFGAQTKPHVNYNPRPAIDYLRA